MSAPAIGVPRQVPSTAAWSSATAPPLGIGLLGAVWGWPFRSITRQVSGTTPSATWVQAGTAFGPAATVTTKPATSVAAYTYHLARPWQFGSDPSTFTLFAAMSSLGITCRGHFVGIGPQSDSGVHLGVGNTDFDSLGTAVNVLYGGVAWKTTTNVIGPGSHTIAATSDGATVTVYVDGRFAGTNTASTPTGGSPSFLHVGNVTGRTSNGHLSETVALSVAAAWNRPLSIAEIAALHADPLAMVRR